MKILQLNCIYGMGSTGKIVRDIHLTLLKNGHESVVIHPHSGAHTDDPGLFTISNKLLSYASAIYRRGFGRQFDGACLQTSKIISILKREKPDVVHLHCINGNDINIYRVLSYLAKNKIKTVLTLHAEFLYTGGCGHAYDCEKWKTGCHHCPILREATQSPIFDGTKHTWKSFERCYKLFDDDKLIITAVSPWLLSRAEQSPFFERFEKRVVLNGVDTSVFKPVESSKKDEKTVFHVTASFDALGGGLKGGRFVTEAAKRLQERGYHFVIAANHGSGEGLPENADFIGRVSDQSELSRRYFEADVTLITSSRETFSMVTAESLCSGTPVAGFLAGGPESIAIPEFSEFVPYGDTDALCEAIVSLAEKEKNAAEISKKAHEKYSREKMTEDYINIYKGF